MSGIKVLGILLLIAGTLCLVYRGFTHTKETHEATLGPLEIQVKDKERIDVPVWVGVALVATGGGLLLVRKRR